MVKVDFTSYQTLASCPAWWRGFVKSVTRGFIGVAECNNRIDEELEKHGCISVDNPYQHAELICLVFESHAAYESFVTYWTLVGDKDGE